MKDLVEEASRLNEVAGKLLERADLSSSQLEEINFRSKSTNNTIKDITTGLGKKDALVFMYHIIF